MTDTYRMPDQQVVTIILPVGLVRKMKGPWHSLTPAEERQVRSAMQHSLWDENGLQNKR